MKALAISDQSIVCIRQPFVDILENTKDGKKCGRHPISSRMYNIFEDAIKDYSIFRNLKWEEAYLPINRIISNLKNIEIKCEDGYFYPIEKYFYMDSGFIENIYSINSVRFIPVINSKIEIDTNGNLNIHNDNKLTFSGNVDTFFFGKYGIPIFQFDKTFISLQIDGNKKFSVYDILQPKQGVPDMVECKLQCRTLLDNERFNYGYKDNCN